MSTGVLPGGGGARTLPIMKRMGNAFAAALVLLATLLMPVAVAAGPRKPAQEHPAPPQDPIAVAVDHYRSLEYDQAQSVLDGVLKDRPEDLHALNVMGTVVLYREMFQRGLLDSQLYGKKGEAFEPAREPVSPEFEKRLFDVLNRAQSLAEARVRKDPTDKEARYWAGVTHGTRATYYFTLKRSWKAALDEARAAQLDHKALLQLDPGFVDANLIVGVQDYLVGALPWPIRVLAALVGAHGDRERGLQAVQLVADKGNYARDDARTVLAVLYQREERWGDARRELQQLVPRFPRGFLSAQELASVCARVDDFRCAASTYDMLLDRYRGGPPNSSWMRFWVAKVLYLSGQAHEKLGENDLALARYSEAEQLRKDDAYIRKSALADADLLKRMGHGEEARAHYHELASSFPDSEEGKAASKALRR